MGTFCSNWCRLLIALFSFFYSCVPSFLCALLVVDVPNSSLHSFILVFLCSFSLVRTSHNGWCWLFLAFFPFGYFYYRLFIAFFFRINFSSSATTFLFRCISILHVVMSISFSSTCYFLVLKFISYFISFVVWLCKFFFFCASSWWFFFYISFICHWC